MTRKEDFSYLTKNKIKNGVITTIRIFGSLKLKRISELLGKAESAVILHLKDLEKNGFIKRDTKQHKERGKFYVLTEKCANLLDNIPDKLVQEDFDEGIKRFKQMSKAEYSNYIAQNIKEQFSDENSGRLQSIQAGALINSNIANIISKDITDVIDIVDQKNNDLNNVNLFLANLSMSMLTIPVSTPSHVGRISELSNEYLKKLKALEEEFSIEIADQSDNNQYVFLFLGPLSGSLSHKEVKITPI